MQQKKEKPIESIKQNKTKMLKWIKMNKSNMYSWIHGLHGPHTNRRKELRNKRWMEVEANVKLNCESCESLELLWMWICGYWIWDISCTVQRMNANFSLIFFFAFSILWYVHWLSKYTSELDFHTTHRYWNCPKSTVKMQRIEKKRTQGKHVPTTITNWTYINTINSMENWKKKWETW